MTTEDQIKLAKLNRASQAWENLRTELRNIESFHSSIGPDKESSLSQAYRILDSTAHLLGARLVEDGRGYTWWTVEE